MTRQMKNPDRPASTNQGSKSKGQLSERSLEILTQYPKNPRRPHNTKKLIEVNGRWFTAGEYSQYCKNLAKEAQTALHPVNGSLESIPETRRLIAEPETTGHALSLSLLRNNCTENDEKTPSKSTFKALRGLNTAHKKTKNALLENVDYLVSTHGIERIGFLTLTFRDHVINPKEAQRRFKSLANHVLTERYPAYIRVIERQKSGRIHYHLLVVMQSDIRTGFDFDQVKEQNYSSANKALRLEWAYWRKTAPLYGFGRTELLPIKTSGRGLGLYVGKYIAKHVEARQEADKGVRLVTYGGNSRNWTTRHTPLNFASTQWRYKCNTFAKQVRASKNKLCHGISDMSRIMGKDWAFKHRDYIMSLEPTEINDCPF